MTELLTSATVRRFSDFIATYGFVDLLVEGGKSI